MQRYFYNDGDKLVSEETNPISLRLIVEDDKVDEVMTALDGQQMSLKSTDFKISPLLKGKAEYMKWQNSAFNFSKIPSAHAALNGGDEDDEEEDAEE